MKLILFLAPTTHKMGERWSVGLKEKEWQAVREKQMKEELKLEFSASSSHTEQTPPWPAWIFQTNLLSFECLIKMHNVIKMQKQ